MSKLTGKGLVEHCKTKLGTPYVYGAKGSYGKFTSSQLNALINGYPSVFTNSYIVKARKFIGKICTDCSGLISWYTGKLIGSYQMYSTAYTRIPIANYKDFADGVVLWRSGHVGVLCWRNGKPYVLEAKGINHGTVLSEFKQSQWTYGLTFKDIAYDYKVSLSDKATWKTKNPYKEPTRTIYYDKANKTVVCRGDDVKWVQWELVEAGFTLDIDGICGPGTEKAIREFQQSCKIVIDGKCGPATRKALLAV